MKLSHRFTKGGRRDSVGASRKRRGVAVTALSVAAVLAVAACSSTDNDTLRVGTLGDAPPNIYIENGVYTGFDNELLKAIAAKEGLKLEFAATEFSSLLSKVANGQFDVGSSAIAQTDERKQTVDFSQPYNFEVMSIQTKEGTSITDETSLAGKRVAVIQGTVGDRWLTSTVPDAQAVRFPDYSAALGALRAGSVEGYILDQVIAEKNVTDNPDAQLKVTKSFTTDTPHGFAVKKGNTELLTKINNGLNQIIADGTWERLHQQFLPNAPVSNQFKANAGS